MHEAYEYAQLVKLTVQIESLAAFGDNLLVGTRQGHLLMYKVTSRYGDPKHEVTLLRYSKNFSKKPIQQLAVVPEYEILVRLSDNIICVHDMSIINFPTITTVQQTKGATLFTLDVKHPTTLTGGSSVLVRMCAVVKRRLLFFYWKNGDFHPLMQDDITVKDIPRALVWCNETICVGFKGEYSLVYLDKNQKDLFPTGPKHQEPSVTKVSEDTFVLGKDTQSVLMNTAGDAVFNLAVKWSEVPLQLAYDEPYLLALLPESIEVRTVEPHLLIQSLPLKARLACYCKQGLVYVASTEHVWCVQSLPVIKQIHVLLEEKQFQLAVKLTNLSDDLEEEKTKNIHQIKTLYAFDLFHNKKFHDSMKEFLKLDTDPYEVIRLFPVLLPQQARDNPKTALKTTEKLDDVDLESGLLALIEYLTEVRRKILEKKTGDKSFESKSTQQLMQIIDTTLLKCYLQTNDALVAPLLRRNYCHLEETEHTLKKHHKYSELIILYQTKGLHHKALELLQKQANQPDSNLRGHKRTVQYLQTLGEDHINVIFQFAGWVLESHPEDGLKIFTEDTAEVEHLPRPKVLDYLLRTQKSLVIPYLEHVIHTWKDTNSIFHNVLIHQYKEKVQVLMTPNATQQEQQAAQHMRAKLLAFLDKSEHYIPETVLVHFPFDCLFEERAIILGKLGRHEQALSIYVSVLSDIQRAREYCDKVYKQDSPGADDVYVLLMRLLISPPDNWLVGITPSAPLQPDLETALSLLEGNAERIPPLKALKELPNSVPLIRIKHFLMTSLQKQLNQRRKTQVLKGLLYAEHLQVHETRMQYESQSVLMTETNVCPVCKKRFGNQSAFVRYPNGDIVHYSCQERRAATNT
uniref:CNH domain-containing protein n=1 Tax=Graphocephala atropunctata TaxID=36148 RepID=A0A1B6MRH7_9HEMI